LKADVKVRIHNKFEIKVIRDGKVIQEGIAENIILDQAWNTFCNFEGRWFRYIRFGTGAGTPIAGGTSLFTDLGSKEATTDEVIRAFPTTSYTRKIVLLPAEYVGETFTEVGISDYGNTLLTHAMIKDAEGNPLTITKTEFDVLEIYATFYSTLDSGSDTGTKMQEVNNSLHKYFSEYEYTPSFSNATFGLSAIRYDTKYKGVLAFKNNSYGQNSKTTDVSSKTITFNRRIDITSTPELMLQFGVLGICSRNLNTMPTWSGQLLENETLGTGDGIKTDFIIPKFPLLDPATNLEVKIDGVVTTAYTLLNGDSVDSIEQTMIAHADSTHEDFDDLLNGFLVGNTVNVGYSTVEKVVKLEDPSSLNGKQISAYLRPIDYPYSSCVNFIIYSSPDGVTWTEIFSESTFRDYAETAYYTFNASYNYLKFKGYNSGTTKNAYIYWAKIATLDSNKPTISFTTAPAIDEVITASYKIEPMDKNENYILDLEASITFSQGV